MSRLAALAVALAVSALAAEPSTAGVARRGNVVMGTVLTVTVVAGTEAEAAALAEAALAEAGRWDDALTIWRPDGELARLNGAAGQGERRVSGRLAVSLAAMLELTAATAGAFDPSVGGLPGDEGRAGGAPGLAQVLHLSGDRALLREGSALDPGAIGKGLALDSIARLLREGGAISAFADFGGSSQTAVGSPPGDEAGWGVLVSALGPGTSHGVVKLRDASVSTSKAGATDTRPVLDPRSGRAVPGPRLATVRAAGAAEADAWSTALVVDGRDGLGRAGRAGVEALVEDARGVTVTGAFALVANPAASPSSAPGPVRPGPSGPGSKK